MYDMLTIPLNFDENRHSIFELYPFKFWIIHTLPPFISENRLNLLNNQIYRAQKKSIWIDINLFFRLLLTRVVHEVGHDCEIISKTLAHRYGDFLTVILRRLIPAFGDILAEDGHDSHHQHQADRSKTSHDEEIKKNQHNILKTSIDTVDKPSFNSNWVTQHTITTKFYSITVKNWRWWSKDNTFGLIVECLCFSLLSIFLTILLCTAS